MKTHLRFVIRKYKLSTVLLHIQNFTSRKSVIFIGILEQYNNILAIPGRRHRRFVTNLLAYRFFENIWDFLGCFNLGFLEFLEFLEFFRDWELLGSFGII